jgi:hypothetical protein
MKLIEYYKHFFRPQQVEEYRLISVKEFPIAADKRYRDKRKRCVRYGSLASHEAIFKVEGASLVGWYCTLHVKELKR